MDETAESLGLNSLLALNTSTGRCFVESAPSLQPARPDPYLEDDQLQLRDIVLVDPVFGSLADKILLASTGTAVTFGWIALGSHQIVELR